MTASPNYTTLVAAAVSTVTLDGPCTRLKLINVNGTSPVYYRVDGTDPTVAGTGAYPLVAVAGATATIQTLNAIDAASVKLISAGTPLVCVIGDNSTVNL